MNVEKLAAAIICYKILPKRKKKTAKRTCWIKLLFRRRVELGACSTLSRELQIEEAQEVRNFVHTMNAVQIQYIGLSNKLVELSSGLTF
nr:unnamed protein product [Callosobruchus analis]